MSRSRDLHSQSLTARRSPSSCCRRSIPTEGGSTRANARSCERRTQGELAVSYMRIDRRRLTVIGSLWRTPATHRFVLARPYCQGCGEAWPPPAQPSLEASEGTRVDPPVCPECGGRVRPWGGLVRRQSSRARVARRDRSRPQVASQMPRRILWQTIAYPQVKRLRCAALALCRGCSSIDELRRVSESTRSPDHRRRLRAVTPNCRRCQRAKALGEENPRSVETSVSDCERSLRWRSSNSRRMSSMS